MGHVNMGLKNLGELERSNLAINIATLLRDSIVTGEFPPGTHLNEVELAQQLGVSRGPLREALRILETEGLLDSYPGRGTFVSHISERDIQEVYSLRCVLEEEAIRLAAECGTTEDFDRLQTTLNDMLNAAEAKNTSEVADHDFRFHQQIWEMADSKLLKNVLEGITTQIRIYLAVQTQLYDDLAEGVSDHKHLLTALRNHDGERGAKVMRDHLQLAAKVVLGYYKEKSDA